MNIFITMFFFLFSSHLIAEESAQVVSSPAVSIPVTTATVETGEAHLPRKGYWVTTFGFEGLEYELPFDFEGEKESFGKEKRKLYGSRLGIGREFYLGLGFNTSTKVEGYYVGTLFESAKTAAPEEETETFSYTKKTGHIYGLEIVQSLGFLFNMSAKNPFLDEMSYFTVEPFIEAGIGRARAYNRLSYHFDTTIKEDYRHRVEDSITTQRFGGGVNFTSRGGYFLYFKASLYNYDVTKRKENIVSKPNNIAQTSFSRSLTDVDMDSVMVYALGGGYKF